MEATLYQMCLLLPPFLFFPPHLFLSSFYFSKFKFQILPNCCYVHFIRGAAMQGAGVIFFLSGINNCTVLKFMFSGLDLRAKSFLRMSVQTDKVPSVLSFPGDTPLKSPRFLLNLD